MEIRKVKRLRQIVKTIKRCHGYVFYALNMNTLTEWILWGHLNNTSYPLKVDTIEKRYNEVSNHDTKA